MPILSLWLNLPVGRKKRAEESGVTLIYTPFAREAFVFIVNADNPVNSLTEQQVRDIFSGAITNWRTVGGNDQGDPRPGNARKTLVARR